MRVNRVLPRITGSPRAHLTTRVRRRRCAGVGRSPHPEREGQRMTAWRRQRNADPHVDEATIEDRRTAPSDRRALARIEVDYANHTDRCLNVIASLMDEYEEYLNVQHAICRGCPVDRSGPFIVYSMLEWRAIYADGRLGHWTRRDIREYLVDHFPRKVSADRQLRRDTPTCVRDFVYFMSDRGTLAGDELDVLADAGDELSDESLAVNKDSPKLGTRQADAGRRRRDRGPGRRPLRSPGHVPAREHGANFSPHIAPGQRRRRSAQSGARLRGRRASATVAERPYRPAGAPRRIGGEGGAAR